MTLFRPGSLLILAIVLVGCSGVKGRLLKQAEYEDTIPVAYQQKILTDAVVKAVEHVDFSRLKAKTGFVSVVGLYPSPYLLDFTRNVVSAKLASQGIVVQTKWSGDLDYRFLVVIDIGGADLEDEYKQFLGFKMGQKGYYQGKVRGNILAYPINTPNAEAIPFDINGLGEKVNLANVRRAP